MRPFGLLQPRDDPTDVASVCCDEADEDPESDRVVDWLPVLERRELALENAEMRADDDGAGSASAVVPARRDRDSSAGGGAGLRCVRRVGGGGSVSSCSVERAMLGRSRQREVVLAS